MSATNSIGRWQSSKKSDVPVSIRLALHAGGVKFCAPSFLLEDQDNLPKVFLNNFTGSKADEKPSEG